MLLANAALLTAATYRRPILAPSFKLSTIGSRAFPADAATKMECNVRLCRLLPEPSDPSTGGTSMDIVVVLVLCPLSVTQLQANSAFHSFWVGKCNRTYCGGRDLYNGRLWLRRPKAWRGLVCGLGWTSALSIWRTAPLRWHMRLATLLWVLNLYLGSETGGQSRTYGG